MRVECLLLYFQHLVQCLAARRCSVNSWQMWLAASKVAPNYPHLLVFIAIGHFLSYLRIWQCWGYVKLQRSITFILLVTFSTYMLWHSKLPCQKSTGSKQLREASKRAEALSSTTCKETNPTNNHMSLGVDTFQSSWDETSALANTLVTTLGLS